MVPYFEITPREIIKGLLEANEYLGLPHSMHVHQNDLGNPGNYQGTIESLKIAEGVKTKNKFGREQVMHSTHLQFHSYGGDGWGTFCSKAKEVMDYVNKAKGLTIDLGCVTLDETTTMTADGPFEHHLHGLNHLKWTNVDVEMETAAGIVPYIYSKDVLPNAIQWATGLELALYAKDMNRTFLTTDHPNAGPFTRYPRVIKWLMSKKAREAVLATMKNTDKVINATDHPQHRPRTHPLRDRPDDPVRPGKMPRPWQPLRRSCTRHERGCRYLRPQLQEHARRRREDRDRIPAGCLLHQER